MTFKQVPLLFYEVVDTMMTNIRCGCSEGLDIIYYTYHVYYMFIFCTIDSTV